MVRLDPHCEDLRKIMQDLQHIENVFRTVINYEHEHLYASMVASFQTRIEDVEKKLKDYVAGFTVKKMIPFEIRDRFDIYMLTKLLLLTNAAGFTLSFTDAAILDAFKENYLDIDENRSARDEHGNRIVVQFAMGERCRVLPCKSGVYTFRIVGESYDETPIGFVSVERLDFFDKETKSRIHLLLESSKTEEIPREKPAKPKRSVSNRKTSLKVQKEWKKWLPENEVKFQNAIAKHGRKWSYISEKVMTEYTPRQLQDKFWKHLNPRNLKKSKEKGGGEKEIPKEDGSEELPSKEKGGKEKEIPKEDGSEELLKDAIGGQISEIVSAMKNSEGRNLRTLHSIVKMMMTSPQKAKKINHKTFSEKMKEFLLLCGYQLDGDYLILDEGLKSDILTVADTCIYKALH